MAAEDRSLNKWKFYDEHVGKELKNSAFISSSSMMIASGPARLSESGATANSNQESSSGVNVFPIALVQNFSMNQQKQLQRVFEIGSYKSHFIGGRTLCSASLGTVLFNGPSLLRSCYANFKGLNGEISKLLPEGVKAENALGGGFASDSETIKTGGTVLTKNKEGSNSYFWMNLASLIFDHAFGLMLYIKDNSNNDYGAVYCEDAHINGHNLGITAGATIIMENVQIQFDTVAPVTVGKPK